MAKFIAKFFFVIHFKGKKKFESLLLRYTVNEHPDDYM